MKSTKSKLRNLANLKRDLINNLINSFAPSEENELLQQQLDQLKEYLKKTNPTLYYSTFSDRSRRIEPKNSLKIVKKLELRLKSTISVPKSSLVQKTHLILNRYTLNSCPTLSSS